MACSVLLIIIIFWVSAFSTRCGMIGSEFKLFIFSSASVHRIEESWLVLIMKFLEKYGSFLVLNIILTVFFGIAFFVSGALGLRAGINPDFFYFQIATTVLGFLLSLFETLLAVSVVKIFAREDENNTAVIKQRNRESIEYPHTQLYEFERKEKFLFFFGVWCLNACVVCLFWGFTCIVSYPTFEIRSYYHFIVTDIVIGYVSPLLLMAGLILIFRVLQLLSRYQFKPESIFASMLVFVDYGTFNGDAWKTYIVETSEGKKKVCSHGFGAWTIANSFHYPIIELDDDVIEIDNLDQGRSSNDMTPISTIKIIQNAEVKIKKWYHYFNWSSWLLGLMLVLNLILSIRFITNATISETKRSHSLSCESIDEDFDCFLQPHYSYVNCSANSSFVGNMICHRYYAMDEVDVLDALIKAIFLFIAFEKFLQLLFTVMATLYKIRLTKVWALIVIAVGIGMICISILCFAFYGSLDTGLIFLSIFQFTILSIDVLLVGLLLLFNKGYYKVGDGRLERYYKPKLDSTARNTETDTNNDTENEEMKDSYFELSTSSKVWAVSQQT